MVKSIERSIVTGKPNSNPNNREFNLTKVDLLEFDLMPIGRSANSTFSVSNFQIRPFSVRYNVWERVRAHECNREGYTAWNPSPGA